MIPVIIIFTFTVMFFSIGPFGAFPLNDDWIYALAALKTAEHFHFAVPGPQLVWAIPQTIFGAMCFKIFGFSHFYLRILTFLTAVAGLIGFDQLLLLRKVRKHARLLANLCLIGFFPFLPLAASSMSDIYFFSLWIYACLAFEIAFKTDQNKMWVIGSLLIMLCSLERQFGIVLAAAVLVYGCVLKSTSLRKVILIVILPMIITGMMMILWRYFPHALKVPLFQYPSVQQRVGNLFCVLLYLGTGVFPFVLASWNWKVKRFPVGLMVGFFLIMSGTWLIAPWNFRADISGGGMPFFGNLLSRYGFFMQGEVLQGFREILFGEWFWKFYTLIGIIGAVFISFELWRLKRDWFKDWSFTGLASMLYLAVIIIIRNPLFDRYLLPVLAGLLLYLAASLPVPSFRMNRVLSIAGALCFIFFSTLLTQDYFRWNEAKWTAANWAVAQGHQALSIDGGYEWTGWHKYLDPQPDENNHSEKIIISFSELENTTIMKKFPYESWMRKGHLFCLMKNSSK